MTKSMTRRACLAGLFFTPVAACAPRTPVPEPREGPLYLGTAAEDVIIDMEEHGPEEALGLPAPRDVDVNPALKPGQIIVDQENFVIRHVHAPGRAREYPVALGKDGLAFSGEAVIRRKAKWPSWRPTNDMIARNPEKYSQYADGVPGGPNNPLGARALYLYRDGRDTYYRIHGTDAPGSIGQSVSNGCIRMLNAHVVELYERVKLGTVVRTRA
jgi:lipoprotein-anchoring transpeptidase ErfK/SrfK